MASQPHTQHLSDLPELSDFQAGLRNAADAFRARLSGVCDSETNNLSSRTSACETTIETMNMGVQHFSCLRCPYHGPRVLCKRELPSTMSCRRA